MPHPLTEHELARVEGLGELGIGFDAAQAHEGAERVRRERYEETEEAYRVSRAQIQAALWYTAHSQ